MSSVRDQLAAQLANFDDQAYEALANRGLLRRARKDLEKSPATIVEETADAVIIGVGEQRVRMDARGPSQATCSCPASGVCQHILAAAIQLQQSGAAPKSVSVSEPSTPEVNPLASLHEALLAFDVSTLTKYSGKAGYRWAWQFLQDLPEEEVRISGDRYIVIEFKRSKFRYLGGGIDSVIADQDIAQIEKYRVAVVLAYQRAHQRPIQPPEQPKKRANEALDLGMDHAIADTPGSIEQSRARLRSSTQQLIRECVELGLSHLSRGIFERFTTLSVWAQGVEYYRLAMLLRRVADHVEQLLDRAGSADEHRLFEELSIAFALAVALEKAAAKGQVPAHLIGQSRTRYTQAGSMELLGLGASAWRSASGYVGLTMLFWSSADRSFFSCSDARPELQRGFNPVARYKAAGPWGGLGAPSLATGRRVILTNAQLNDNGRLSAAESTVATVQPPVAGEEIFAQLEPFAQWAALDKLDASTQSLLAEPQPLQRWAALAPTRFGVARFDQARQMMIWPLFDQEDLPLDVELPYSDFTAPAIERIEQLNGDALPSGTLLIAQVRRGPTGFVAMPLSLIRKEVPAGASAVDALFFDPAPRSSVVSNMLGKLRSLGTPAKATETDEVEVQPPPPPALRNLRQSLASLAERGVPQEAAREATEALRQQIDRARSDGFTALAWISTANVAEQALRLHYLCLQYEQLSGRKGFA